MTGFFHTAEIPVRFWPLRFSNCQCLFTPVKHLICVVCNIAEIRQYDQQLAEHRDIVESHFTYVRYFTHFPFRAVKSDTTYCITVYKYLSPWGFASAISIFKQSSITPYSMWKALLHV